MVYEKAQAEYFAKGNYTETEERVEGSPEYAFNEYLQLAIEGGIIFIFLGSAFFFVNSKAARILQRLQKVSCNPLSYCVQGNNYLEIKDYKKS